MRARAQPASLSCLFSLTNVSRGRCNGGEQVIGTIRQRQEIHCAGLHYMHSEGYIASGITQNDHWQANPPSLEFSRDGKATRVRLMNVEHDAA